MPSSAATHGSSNSMPQIGPSRRPWRGQWRRDLHGVRMIPTNTRPASNDASSSTATSFRRTSFNLTMISAPPASRQVGRFVPKSNRLPRRSMGSGGFVAARLRFDGFFALETRQKLVVRHRLREHRIVFLDGRALFFFAQRRGAILERDDVVAFLVAGAHRRLDAAVGEESAERDRRYTAAAQDEIEVRGGEPAQAAFAFDDNVARRRLQDVDDFRAPRSLAERF